MAVAGTKHTITTDTNNIIHRKRVSKPLTNAFQNPLSRSGENPREPDGRVIQMTIQPIRTEDDTKSPERTSTPKLEDSVLETTLQLSPSPNTSPSYGRGRKKLIGNRAEKSPVQGSPGIHIENMTAEQEEEFRQEPDENPEAITVTDRNGNTNSIKTEQIEDININTNENHKKITTRKHSRIKSANPIIRYGNPITH